jgi:hypothetical protein
MSVDASEFWRLIELCDHVCVNCKYYQNYCNGFVHARIYGCQDFAYEVWADWMMEAEKT